MASAKEGDRVRVHYTGSFEDGTVFDSSAGKEPFEFKLGEGQVIRGFDTGIMGMEVGDKKKITIDPENAYGPWREEMVLSVKPDQFPEHIEPEVGKQLQIPQKNGPTLNVVITEVSEDNVLLDGNHPLAGKTLVFEIELVDIAA
jgi:peptidylprolyl isomerase